MKRGFNSLDNSIPEFVFEKFPKLKSTLQHCAEAEAEIHARLLKAKRLGYATNSELRIKSVPYRIFIQHVFKPASGIEPAHFDVSIHGTLLDKKYMGNDSSVGFLGNFFEKIYIRVDRKISQGGEVFFEWNRDDILPKFTVEKSEQQASDISNRTSINDEQSVLNDASFIKTNDISSSTLDKRVKPALLGGEAQGIHFKVYTDKSCPYRIWFYRYSLDNKSNSSQIPSSDALAGSFPSSSYSKPEDSSNFSNLGSLQNSNLSQPNAHLNQSHGIPSSTYVPDLSKHNSEPLKFSQKYLSCKVPRYEVPASLAELLPGLKLYPSEEEILQALWAYIEKNKLYNESDRRFLVFDDVSNSHSLPSSFISLFFHSSLRSWRPSIHDG